jgi:hypothetical protein
MAKITVSRRNLLAAGACAMAWAVALPVSVRAGEKRDPNLMSEELIRKWYTAWKDKDFTTFNDMLADNFTFSSAAGDDHISKTTFKTQCWDTQINFIKDFDLERVTTGPNDAFVKYLCYTQNGKSFRNVEYLRIDENGKLISIECYFGAQSSFPSAVSKG